MLRQRMRSGGSIVQRFGMPAYWGGEKGHYDDAAVAFSLANDLAGLH
jgi:hypothetical protein